MLQFAPSTYYDNKTRPPSRRQVSDAELGAEIARVYEENHEVYGAEKIWRQLHREGISCGRDRVARLMRELKIAGVTRARRKKTTIPAKTDLPSDLVKRNFNADGPNRLWVNDLTYVPVSGSFAYTAFVIDAYSRRIVGWKVSTSLTTDAALDALEMAIFARRGESLDGLVHHSDRGVQYLAIRYTARMEDAGIVPSVGSKGDSYDNALAETVNGLYKAELINRRQRWENAAESSGPPPSGWRGGTTPGSTAPVASCRRPSTRQLAARREQRRPEVTMESVMGGTVAASVSYRRHPATVTAFEIEAVRETHEHVFA